MTDLQSGTQARVVVFKRGAVVLSCLLIVAAVAGAVTYALTDGKVQATAKVITACLYVLGPPLWFLLEAHNVAPKNKEQFDYFKYCQDLSRNLWLAGGLLLGWLFGFSLK